MARAYEERDSRRKRPRGRNYQYQKPVSIISGAPLWNGRPCWLLPMAEYARVLDGVVCPYCTAAKATHYAVPVDNGNVTLICPAPEDVERLKNVVLAAKSAPSDRDIERLTRGGGVTAKNLILTALKEQALRVAGTPFVEPAAGDSLANGLAYASTPYPIDVTTWMGATNAAVVRVAIQIDMPVLGGQVYAGVGSFEIRRARLTDALADENSRCASLGRLRYAVGCFLFDPKERMPTQTEIDLLVDSTIVVCDRLSNAVDVELRKAAATRRIPETVREWEDNLRRSRQDAMRLSRGNVATEFTPNTEFTPSARQSQYFGPEPMNAGAIRYAAQSRPTTPPQTPARETPPVVQRKKRGFHFDDD